MRRISEGQTIQATSLSATAARDIPHDIGTANTPAGQLSFPNLSSAKSFFNSVKKRLSQYPSGNSKPTDLSLDEIRDWYRLGQVYQHTVSDTYEPDQYIMQCCTSEDDSTLLERAKNWHPFIAVLENKVENMEALLRRRKDLEPKFDVNAARDRLGRTCLHLAAAKSRDQMAALLIEHDADIYARDPSGATPYRTEPIHDAERGKLPKEATVATTSMTLPIPSTTIAAKSEELSAFQSQEGTLHFYGRQNWPILSKVSGNFIIYLNRQDNIHPLLRKTPDELSKQLSELLLWPKVTIQVVVELKSKDLANLTTMSLTLDEVIAKGIVQERLLNRVRRIIREHNLTGLHELSEFSATNLEQISLAQKLGFIQLNSIYEEVIGGQENQYNDQDRVYALLNKQEQKLIDLSQQWNIHFLARKASQDALDLLQEILSLIKTQQISINLNELSRSNDTCLEKILTIMAARKPNGKASVVLLKHGCRSRDQKAPQPVFVNNDDDMEYIEGTDDSFITESAFGPMTSQGVHSRFALVKGQTQNRDKQATFLFASSDDNVRTHEKRPKNRKLFNQHDQGGHMQGRLPVSVQSPSPSQGHSSALILVTNLSMELQQVCDPVQNALVKVDNGNVSIPPNCVFATVVAVSKGKDATAIDQSQLIQHLSTLPQLNNGEVIDVDGVKLTVLQYCAFKGLQQVANFILRKGFPENKITIANGLHPNHIAVLNRRKDYVSFHLQKTQQFHDIQLPSGIKFNELHFALFIHNFPLASICTQHVVITNPMISFGGGTLVHLASAFGTGIRLPQLLLHYPYKDGTSLRSILNTKDRLGRTPLGCAAEMGHLRQVQFYLRLFSYDLMLQSELMEIPRAFYQAAQAGQVEVVRYFLDNDFVPSSDHNTSEQAYYDDTLYILRSSSDDKLQSVLSLIKDAVRQHSHKRYTKPNPKTQVYDAYVYEGGGMKGAIFPYAREALIRCCEKRARDLAEKNAYSDERDRRLLATEAKRIAGTSAGSIFAFMDAMDVPDAVVRREMARDFSEFLEDKSQLAQTLLNDGPILEKVKELLKSLGIRVEKIMSIVEQAQASQTTTTSSLGTAMNVASTAANVVWNGRTLLNEFQEAVKDIKKLDQKFSGFVSGTEITKWLAGLITSQGFSEHMTFGEWGDLVNTSRGRYKHFCLVTTCIDTGEPILLSSELPSSRNYVILRALCASMAIPIVFEEVKLLIKTGSTFSETAERHWDGGLLCNYLITQYSKKFYTDTSAVGESDFPTFNAKTLGFRFKFRNPTLTATATFKEQLLHLAKIFYQAENILGKFNDRDYGRSIELDTGEDLGTLSFRTLGPEDIRLLTRNAREAVCGYYGYRVEEIFPEEPRMVHSIEVLNSGSLGLHAALPSPAPTASSRENPAPQGPGGPNA